MKQSTFEQFTRKYSLSKTLRFELRPVGKTRENIEKVNPGLFHDQEIEDAYQVLKPVFDKLHEEFITKSLENSEAKKILVSDYYNLHQEFRKEQDKNKKIKIEKNLEKIEGNLRNFFDLIWSVQGDDFKKFVGVDEKEKEILKESGFKVLTEAGILKYIKKNIEQFAQMNLKTRDGKKVGKKSLEKALGTTEEKGVFEGFFTYFSGFNQNRENYYSTEEKSTAVANRIITENLPKFCDNVFQFNERKSEYLVAHDFLASRGIGIGSKGQKGEDVDLVPITIEIFEIEYFKDCLSQGEIDRYNLFIGNANNLINRYNQQQDDKSRKLRLFKTLYKQIGCGQKSEFISIIKDDEVLRVVLKKVADNGRKYFGTFDQKIDGKVDTIGKFVHYVQTHDNFKGIYWNDKALNTISGKYFANWYLLKKALKEGGVFGGKKRDDQDIKIPQAVELHELFAILDKVENWQEKGVLFKDSLFEDGKNSKKEIIVKGENPSKVLLGLIFTDLENFAKKFAQLSPQIEKITDYKNDITKIKEWLDCLLLANQIVKYWKVKDKFAVEAVISESLKSILFSDHNPTNDYDIVRNYLTKKPQEDLNKLKLNFDNSVLAGGWDVNKEPERWCVLLKDRDSKIYLAILTSKTSKFFEKNVNNTIYNGDDSGLQKMDYKLLPGPNKMLPKVLLPKSDPNKFGATDEILSIYREGGFKKNELTFTKEKLGKIIDFFKEGLKIYPNEENSWQNLFNFKFQNTGKYESIDQFYVEVEKQGYKLTWSEINKTLLDKEVSAGGIFLFEIKNKDSNLQNGSEKLGSQNLHTIYWNAVFGNNDNKPKLNGEAEIFYRPVVKDLIKNKDGNGNPIKSSKKRFEQEKFVFHCPITFNFCLKSSKFNDEINDILTKDSGEIVSIGIDRGEKHLAYYSVLKKLKDGTIVSLDQGSLNLPFLDKNNKPRSVKVEKYFEEDKKENGEWKPRVVDCWDYNDLLDARASNRDLARKNWKTIGTIKELKDGYISQVVRKIVDLAIYEDMDKKVLRETPAFIVLENLNIGFKRGRQKIEKQVYQKLELALAKKLNFLVDKNAKIGELGSVTRALQLTPPVSNFGDIEGKKQFGIMLYTKADYTSQTDPATGWRRTIYLKRGSEESVKKQIIESFDDIRFDGNDYYFKYTDKNTKKPWMLYSGKDGQSLDRYYRELVNENSDKKWIPKKQDITGMLNELFDGFAKNTSLLEQLKNGRKPNKINEQTGWESLRFVIDLIQQIRNTGTSENDSDFIYSPVRDEDGNHFDSRKAGDGLPTSGDANGAYNIARKGIIMCEHIKQDWNLFISDDEWSAWLAGNEVWKKWTENNIDKLKKSRREE